MLWIDPYPTRFPSFSDFWKIGENLDNIQSIAPSWIKIIRPFGLPIEPIPGSGLINWFMWKSVFEEAEVFSSHGDTLLAIGKPSVLAMVLLRRFVSLISLYDAMDDFPSFYSGISKVGMRLRERQIVDRVGIVLASSTTLKQKLDKVRPDTQLVRNGLDITSLPSRMPAKGRVEKFVFGYLGTMGSWFDWEWLIDFARVRSKDTVRLIGPIFTAVPQMLPNNVEFLPPCSHIDALLAMQRFDAGLIPFIDNELTASVDPIKYYEYKALGLPVISTNFGEMSFRSTENGVFVSSSIEDVESIVARALLYKANDDDTRRFVSENSWEKRFTTAKIF